MPVRNLWSLEPGECITAEELVKRLDCEVYFPTHDVGVDLLVVKGEKRALVNCSVLSHDELKMLIRQIKVMNNRIEEVEGWLIGSWNLYSSIRMGNGIH